MTSFPESPQVKTLHKGDDVSDSIPELDFNTACRLLDNYIDFVSKKIDMFRFHQFEAPKKRFSTMKNISNEIKSNPLTFSLLIPFDKRTSEMQKIVNESHYIYEHSDLDIWKKMEIGLKLEKAEDVLQIARQILKDFKPYIQDLSVPSSEK